MKKRDVWLCIEEVIKVFPFVSGKASGKGSVVSSPVNCRRSNW